MADKEVGNVFVGVAVFSQNSQYSNSLGPTLIPLDSWTRLTSSHLVALGLNMDSLRLT